MGDLYLFYQEPINHFFHDEIFSNPLLQMIHVDRSIIEHLIHLGTRIVPAEGVKPDLYLFLGDLDSKLFGLL